MPSLGWRWWRWTKTNARRGLLAATSVVATSACTFLVDLDGLEGGGADVEPTGSGSGADAADDVAVDASLEAEVADASDASSDDAFVCPTGRGPAMVAIEFHGQRFCIDSTEVTNDEYAAFLVAKAGDVSGQVPLCANNLSYGPNMPWPVPDGGSLPVVAVDYCDARAFCEWAGKRLCGALDGGPAEYGVVHASPPARTQWYMACTHNADGAHKYPYGGNTCEPGTCNGADVDAGPDADASAHLAPAGSFSSCVGGFPGLFDMSGNVAEWEDSCSLNDAGALDRCTLRGGGYADLCRYGNLACAAAVSSFASTTSPTVGFRCCAP